MAGFPSLLRGASMSTDVVVRMNLVDGVEAIRSGKLSSLDYCTAALEQAEIFREYNIFTQTSPVYVQTAASEIDARREGGAAIGAFQGVPYALKDSVDMVEYYTISGHPALRYFEPSIDADLVTLCKKADAVCIGKTQIPPLSMWWTTENPMTGNTGNPFNRAYKTGGSSGGSGAAVAARIVPFAIGEDTAGSVRVPAAVNGVQGLRPTTGRWPTAGTMPIGFSDTLGPIARSIADIKLLDSVIAVDQPENETGSVDINGLRIGYQRAGFFDDLHPWVEKNIDATMKRLSDAGVELIEIEGLSATESYSLAISILLADYPAATARYFNRHRVYDMSGFGLMHEMPTDAFKKAWLPGMEAASTGEAYFDLVLQLKEARNTYQKVMADNDLGILMYPSTKIPNTPNDGSDVIVGKGPLGKALPETMIGANMLFAPAMRSPSISMYSGMDDDGLPLSVTFDGLSGYDRRLLDVAEAIEGILPHLEEPESA